MTSKEYAKQGGVRCPVCNSDDIDGGYTAVDERGASQPIDCLACGSSWLDVYKLMGYTNLTEGEKQDASDS